MGANALVSSVMLLTVEMPIMLSGSGGNSNHTSKRFLWGSITDGKIKDFQFFAQ